MTPDLEKFRRRIEQWASASDARKDLYQDFQKIEAEIGRLNFRFERVVKEKQTLSTLLARTSEDLEKASEIIKKMFGRYLSTEVMNSLLEDPGALDLGGEKRVVTIMITDLRGFSALCERLTPEQVVQMLNAYFEVMVDVILTHHGTINEIIGDALLVIFGAPQQVTDRTQRAVACAIEMQNAMSRVNENNRNQGLPKLEMGIGINETEVIVGNIGSSKRSKYAVVGSGVNMTSRIESYSVGGQVLISESVKAKIGHLLRIDARLEVTPKGMQNAMQIFGVNAIAGSYNLSLMTKNPRLNTLARPIPFRYLILEGKHKAMRNFKGTFVKLSTDTAEAILNSPVANLANLQMELDEVDHKLSSKQFYGKLINVNGKDQAGHLIRFTSIPPEIDAFFQAHLQYAVDARQADS